MDLVFSKLTTKLAEHPSVWLVSGVAGFVGSNLLEALLKLDQKVVGLDNFATGHRHNLDLVKGVVSTDQWARFNFIEGDIRNIEDCRLACTGVDYVLHQAALGSVPRSLENPASTNETNVSGFLNMLIAARDAEVRKFVYAASSSTYGDHPALPKVEGVIGNPLSPYAVTKLVNELYADVFGRSYGMKSVGLRYFNIFGPRQDPNGAYAAVIPKWASAMINNEELWINGDGETSRDFCFVANAIQANLLAATNTSIQEHHQVFNVAVSGRTSLNQLFEGMRFCLNTSFPHLDNYRPQYRDFRKGDVKHSQADISKAQSMLGYQPSHTINDGLKITMEWYVDRLNQAVATLDH